MKPIFTKLLGAAVLASSVLTAVAPAQARHRYHQRDRVDAGDVIAGIFLIGAIAAIAGSGDKAKQRERRNDDYRYDLPPREEDYRAAPGPNTPGQWVPGSNSAETRAVDACSWAAEGQLSDNARVGEIASVAPEGDGWRVDGTVAAPENMPRDFSCSYRAGRVTNVTIR